MKTDTDDESLVRLDQQLCFMLYACSRSMTRACQPLLQQLQLTYPQYLVMMVLWEWSLSPPPEATVTALGERLYLDSGTLTPLLKRLQKSGMITRQRDSADERRVLIAASEQGLQMKSLALAFLAQQRELPGELDAVRLRKQLKHLLELLSSAGKR